MVFQVAALTVGAILRRSSSSNKSMPKKHGAINWGCACMGEPCLDEDDDDDDDGDDDDYDDDDRLGGALRNL